MERRTATSLVLAVCCVFAVGLAAATLTDTSATQPGVPGGDNESGGILAPPAGEDATGAADEVDVPYLSEILLVLGVLAAVGLLYYLYHDWRAAFGFVLALLVILALVYLFFQLVGPPEFPGGAMDEPREPPDVREGAGGEDDGAVPPVSTPTLLLVGLLALALVGTALALFGRVGDRTENEVVAAEAEGDRRSAEAAAIGGAAGRAADRIEERETFDNEVYRAWREMVGPLEVPNPETTTPGEFEAAAVEAGVERGDAAALTALFEEVRYGGREASGERERRAVETLRRIETRYGAES
ncbi:DUF4129 domain-containing protein [Natronorarus salvus]|uniref:DUF4129 domain-containing protein n=1 Tax=Natronorarus salvus TaxID=3117733 RepID=UPI002F25F1DD